MVFPNYNPESNYESWYQVYIFLTIFALPLQLLGLLSVIFYVYLIFKIGLSKKKIITANISKCMKWGLVTGLLLGGLLFYPYRINVTEQSMCCEPSDKVFDVVLFFVFTPLAFSMIGYFWGKRKDRKMIN